MEVTDSAICNRNKRHPDWKEKIICRPHVHICVKAYRIITSLLELIHEFSKFADTRPIYKNQ